MDNNLSSLQIFLEFVEREELYDIFAPTASNMKGEGGFRINSNDSRLTSKVRKCLYKCTRTFVSTVDNKSVRVRFLGKENLESTISCEREFDVERFERLSEKIAESSSLCTLSKWLNSQIVKQRVCKRLATNCYPDSFK